MPLLTRPRVALIASLLLAIGCSHPLGNPVAQSTAPTKPGATNADLNPVYLAKNALSNTSESALPPPAATGSPKARAELQQILKLQSTRSDADCARAKSEVPVTLAAFFGPPYGPLTTAEVEKLNPFFAKIEKDVGYFTYQEKSRFKRPRPYLEDASIQPCLPLDPTQSYPSGHATMSRVFADILAEIDPSRKAQFKARANQIARDRVLGGVHHPSDVQMGQKLGDEIFRALEKNPSFQQDLDKARHS